MNSRSCAVKDDRRPLTVVYMSIANSRTCSQISANLVGEKFVIDTMADAPPSPKTGQRLGN